MGTGTLYLCGTPIGNLEDISLRVLRLLAEVDLVVAEDTRHTRKLLSHYGIRTSLTSFHAYSRGEKAGGILARLKQGASVALVSDAGTPGISDPGSELVAQAIREGITVVSVPGPSAVLAALVVSGLRTDRFVFEGFLPRKGRKRALEALQEERRTIVLFESPQRLASTLEDILSVLGDRKVAVARELTKQYEEVFRGTVREARNHFSNHPARGEITLVLEGAAGEAKPVPVDRETMTAEVAELQARGRSRAEALREVARRHGIGRRELYGILLAGLGENKPVVDDPK
ncbi:MAG: 16S rRNA (cytidine(1402)-2'-O)-methyltransferase [Candidatus Desulforudis sp.]|nr:16S rRNA (cytidine(1402)-2'-O)-methyltransferase [Desulforudis sp.]